MQNHILGFGAVYLLDMTKSVDTNLLGTQRLDRILVNDIENLMQLLPIK